MIPPMNAEEAPEVVGTVLDREVNSHTLIGLGMMACALLIVWLLRRTKAKP